MARNESGDNDPWKNRKKNQGPPDLDKLFGQFHQRLRGLLKEGNGSGGNTSGSSENASLGIILGIVFFGIIIIWLLSSFYIVHPAEEAVVLRFGRYVETQGPGLHFAPTFIEKAYKIDTILVHDFIYKSDMLTKDESIIDVEISVQYRRSDPEAFLFNVANPVMSLKEASASALRQVIGHNDIDDVLTNGRALVKQQVKTQLKTILALYNTGIDIVDVNLQSAVPPAQVRDAFDDAIRAQEDQRRYKRQAEAYRKQIIPAAYGQARSVIAHASAYQRKVQLAAEGSTAGFKAILPEYKKAPVVTRERIYLSTIEFVLKSNQMVLVDVHQANNLLYIPMDKILAQQNVQAHQVPGLPAASHLEPTKAPVKTPNTGKGAANSYLSIADRDSYLGRFEQ